MVKACRKLRLIVFAVAAALTSSCILGPGKPITPEAIDREAAVHIPHDAVKFEPMPDPKDSKKAREFGSIKRVYVGGPEDGPSVILLHEIPGLRPGDIDVGLELAKTYGFRVYMPLMFGTPGQNKQWTGQRQACKSGLFNCADRDTHHDILKDLVQMTNVICADKECGIVGMCLTGSLPLYLMPEKNVVAAVIAQPTLPFFHVWPFVFLDISEEDTNKALAAAADRAASIYMLRYRHDYISGHAAFNKLRARIENYKDKSKLTYFAWKEFGGFSHSTLVHDTHANEEHVKVIADALNKRLPKQK